MNARGDDPGSREPPGFDDAETDLLDRLAPVIVSHIDLDGRTTSIHGALLERLGYAPEWFLDKTIGDISDDEYAASLVRRALAGQPCDGTIELNGRPWLVSLRPVTDDDGEVAGAVSVITFADEAVVHQELTAKELLNRQLEAVIELSQDFIALVGLDRRILYLNRAGRDLVGLEDDDEVIGRSSDDLLPPEGVQRTRDEEARFLREGSWAGESSLRHVRTGEVIPVFAQTYLVSKSLDGRPLAIASVRRDLREQQAADRTMAVRVQEQRSLALLGRNALTLPLPQLMDEAVRLVAGRYQSLQSGVMRLTADGRTTRMVASSAPEWVDVQIEVGRDSLTGLALIDNVPTSTDDVVADPRFSNDGPTVQLDIRSAICCPIPSSGQRPWGMVGVAGKQPHAWTDDDQAFVESVASILGAAVQRHELESQLQHQALHDPLTGLPNRALVLDRVDHALGRSARQGSLVAVLLLDVDDFKSINDALGHGTGDRLLAELAVRLEAVAREGDTVARLGGDEFVVVCEDLTVADVPLVAETLLEACTSGFQVDGHPIAVSASIGVALATSGTTSTTALLGEADIAMYRAKRDRPGSYQTFDEAMRGDVLERITIAGELRAAVHAGEIDLVYQPIVDLATGQVSGVEALARWSDGEGRPVSPDVFIAVAEETGLICDLGLSVLRSATRAAAGWQDLREVTVRVNASAHELRSTAYVDGVLDALRDSGLAAGLLGIEITESVLIDEDRVTLDNLTRLREHGVTLLIDDFGTGYSSLSYLQRFPVVDVLKIDRSFLGAGTRGEAVVQAVVGLGRAFDLRVCAEGVETPEQHARVIELGCDFAQGYLLGRPVPRAQVPDLLADWQPRLPVGA